MRVLRSAVQALQIQRGVDGRGKIGRSHTNHDAVPTARQWHSAMSPHAYLKSASVSPQQFCQKIAFDTRQHARRAAAKTVPPKDNVKQHSTFGTLSVYRCKFCEGNPWHIGHS